MVFGGGMLGHWVCMSYVRSDVLYYVTDAVVLVCVAESMRHLLPVTRLNLFIQKICGAAICLNLLGLVLWYNYETPKPYDSGYTVLYVTVLYVMLKRGMDGPIHARHSTWFFRNRLNGSKGYNIDTGNDL